MNNKWKPKDFLSNYMFEWWHLCVTSICQVAQFEPGDGHGFTPWYILTGSWFAKWHLWQANWHELSNSFQVHHGGSWTDIFLVSTYSKISKQPGVDLGGHPWEDPCNFAISSLHRICSIYFWTCACPFPRKHFPGSGGTFCATSWTSLFSS